MLRGRLAAAVTPLRDGGAALDEAAFGPYVDFLAAGGLDGILALGTTGEGILLSTDERRRAAELFVEAAGGRLQVAVHCGAQTTADTVELAATRPARARMQSRSSARRTSPTTRRRSTDTSPPPREACRRRCPSTSTSSRREPATRFRWP